MVIFPWPVLVVFVTEVCGKRGWYLRLRSELRCRPVVTRVARIMPAAASVWAARAAVEVVAVTKVWVIERVHSLRTPVNETWPVDTRVSRCVVASGGQAAAGRSAALAAAVAADLRGRWPAGSPAQKPRSPRGGSFRPRVR